MSKLQCGVIGAGWWGTTAHVPAIKQHAGAELVAVHHHDLATARKIAADFDIPHAYSSADELLATPGLQAVVVSSTPNLHYSHAKAALGRGMHVLIEKPMTFTAAEAAELVDIAQKADLQFLVSAPWHYTAHGQAARDLIQGGALGRVHMISILMTNFTDGLYYAESWDKAFGRNPTLQNPVHPYLIPGQTSYSDPKIAGGGQIYCQVSHAASYLSYLTGAHPAEVFARLSNVDAAVDLYDTLNIKMDNGAIVSLASTGSTMHSERNYEVRVYGDHGMVLLELWKGTLEFHKRDCSVVKYPELAADDVYPMFGPTWNLIDCVAGTAKNESPATLGLDAMRIIEGAVTSARTGANVPIRA